jgi:predicted component of type VI protein secretion system
MENKYRINWKRGLDVTPEILISSDNYHIAERNMVGAFIASRIYGILPEGKFYIESEINNNRLTVKNLNCFALTCNGNLISIPKDMRFQKDVSLNDASGNELYVVLTVNPNGKISENEKEPYLYPDYNLTLKRTSENFESGIPVIKIKNNNFWEIDANYIPPSFAINASELLLKKFTEIKKLINRVLDIFPDKTQFHLHHHLLRFELNDFTVNKSPEEWKLLMKKFCWIFYSHLKNEKKIDENQNMKSFIAEPFNPNEIGKIFQLGLKCFEEVNAFFEAKPIVEIEELEV